MTILTFLIGAAFLLTGLGSLAYCIDLVPTEMGRLYAQCGAMLVSASGIIFAIASLIARLNRIFAPPRRTPAATALVAAPADEAPPPAPPAVAVVAATAEPQVVARYNAGDAQYVVYSDGAIEAETPHGGLRFASMDALKAYIADRQD